MPPNVTPKPRKYKPCQHYAKRWGCARIYDCPFLHDTDIPPRYRDENKPCHNFAKNGQCPFGTRCRYRHGPPPVGASSTALADAAQALSLKEGSSSGFYRNADVVSGWREHVPSGDVDSMSDDASDCPTEESSVLDWSVTACSDDGRDDKYISVEPQRTGLKSRSSSPSSTRTTRPSRGNDMITFISETSQQTWEEHSSVFTSQSVVFQRMFAFAREESAAVIDPCETLPGIARVANSKRKYKLKGVSDYDFDSFLRGVKPRLGQENPLERLSPMLILATDWRFVDLRAFAIREIPKHVMDPLKKVVLARRTRVPSWLREPYIALAVRLASLEHEEILTLGTQTTTAITRARERVLHRRLDLVRGDTPAPWMGGSFWHSGCWKTVSEAWRLALKDPRWSRLAPDEAVEKSLRELKTGRSRINGQVAKPLCRDCIVDTQTKIAKWLALAEDDKLAESVLKESLGRAPDAWIYKE